MGELKLFVGEFFSFDGDLGKILLSFDDCEFSLELGEFEHSGFLLKLGCIDSLVFVKRLRELLLNFKGELLLWEELEFIGEG